MTLVIKQAGLAEYLEGGSEKIKVLLAGTPGAGKTRLASFAPRPIYADCEGGLMSVADRGVDFGRIKSEADMDAFLGILRQEAMRPEAGRRWETVVVDTLDKYQRLVIAGYLRREKKKEMSGWEDWGYLDAAMNRLISTLMELPFNVIVLAHVKETQIGQGDTKRSILSLDLKGSQRDSLPGDFDFVGLLENEWVATTENSPGSRIKRVIRWEPTPNVDWLKARGGGLMTTVASFDEAGYAAIRDGIRAQMANIVEGQVIQEVQTVEEGQPALPPQPGGPVSTGLARPRAAAAPKGQAQLPAAPPAPPAAAQAPLAVTPPPPVKRPEPPQAPPAEVEQTMEEGVAVVEEALGGKVIEDTMPGAGSCAICGDPDDHGGRPHAEATGDGKTRDAEAPADVQPSAPVAEPVAEAAEPVADEPQSQSMPESGEHTITVKCGDPRYPDATPTPGVGCGEPLTVTIDGNRVVGAQEGQQPGIIDIAALKFRAFLHNACFNKARAATSA